MLNRVTVTTRPRGGMVAQEALGQIDFHPPTIRLTGTHREEGVEQGEGGGVVAQDALDEARRAQGSHGGRYGLQCREVQLRTQ